MVKESDWHGRHSNATLTNPLLWLVQDSILHTVSYLTSLLELTNQDKFIDQRFVVYSIFLNVSFAFNVLIPFSHGTINIL